MPAWALATVNGSAPWSHPHGRKQLPVIDSNKRYWLPEVCWRPCPKGILTLLPETVGIYVACNSNAPAREVTSACKVGCIACRICEKACPFDAIHVKDNLAVIDYEKCRQCGICVKKCPRNIIIDGRIKKAQAV